MGQTRIAIDINGQERIVEFERMPTEAEIDEAARQLRAQLGAPAPAAKPKPQPQGFFRSPGAPQLPTNPLLGAAGLTAGFTPAPRQQAPAPAPAPRKPSVPGNPFDPRKLAADRQKFFASIAPDPATARDQQVARDFYRSQLVGDLEFTPEAFQSAMARGLSAVRGKRGQAIDIGTAQRQLMAAQGQKGGGVKFTPQTEEQQAQAMAPQVGADVGFNRGQTDAQVARGGARKDVFDANNITSSARLRRDVNALTKGLEDRMVADGASPITAGLIAGALTSALDLGADMQTIGDPGESVRNKVGATINAVLKGGTGAVMGPVIAQAIKPVLKGIGGQAFETLVRDLAPMGEDLAALFRSSPDEAKAKFLQSLSGIGNAPNAPAAPGTTARPLASAFENDVFNIADRGIMTQKQAQDTASLWRARAAQFARETGAENTDAFYEKFAPTFRFDEQVPEGALNQIEDLLLGNVPVPVFSGKNSLPAVAKWVDEYAQANPVFSRPVAEISDQDFVDGIVEHTLREVSAWKKVATQYKDFYGDDIVKTANPELQSFAQGRYGRQLTDGEVRLYHILGAFASPSANPEFDSRIGLRVLDRFLTKGELSAYDESKRATVWVKGPNGDKVDTGQPRFDDQGNPVFAQVSRTYAADSLEKVKKVIDHFGGDIDAAMEWLGSVHSRDDIAKMFGVDQKSLPKHEYLDQNGGFGVFGVSGPKLGSYVLNRWQEFSTVTKDMWYARTMARLTGDPLVVDGKVLSEPWKLTKEGLRRRKLADVAWDKVASLTGGTPAHVQQWLWDAEQMLYGKMGVPREAKYVSDGLRKGIEDITFPNGRPGSAPKNVRVRKPVGGDTDGGGVGPADTIGVGGSPSTTALAQRDVNDVVKGAVSFPENERPVINLFTGSSDVSTILHESAHIWRRTLTEADQSILTRHFGDFSTVQAEEGFARAVERYLRDGSAPTPELQGVFDRFKSWLSNIYARLKGSPIEDAIHPEVRGVMDRMLGGGQLAPTPTRSANTIFTDAARDEALARMATIAQRFGRAGSGIDPEELIQFGKDAVVLAGYAIERGARDSAAWVADMVDQFGEGVRPVLEKAWREAQASLRREDGTQGSMLEGRRETTSARNSATSAFRREAWLDDVPERDGETVQQWLDEARERGLVGQARQIAQSVINNPRSLSDRETAALMDRMSQVRQQYADILNRSRSLQGDELRNAEQALLELRSEMDELTRATKTAGTEWGRAGVARQAELDAATDEVTVLARARIAAGRDLTPEEEDRFKALIQELEGVRARLAEAEARIELSTNEGRELAETRQRVSDLQDQLAEAQARAEVYGDDGTQARLQQELDAANKRISELQDQLARAKAEIEMGGGVGKERALDPEVNELEGQEKRLRDRIRGERERLEIQNHTTSYPEAFLGIRRAGLLGTLRGLARDVIGTAAGSAFDTISMIPAGVMDAALGVFTGRRTMRIADPKAYAEGLTAFWGKGMRDAVEVMRRGATPEDLARQDVQREFNVINPATGQPMRVLNGYVNYIMRARATPERPFRAMWFARAIAEQANIQARAEGFRGAELKRRVRNLIENPTEAMTINAAARAEEAVFANSNKATQIVSGVKRAGGAPIAFGVDFVVPFKQVPSNIGGRILESSPLGGIKLGALIKDIGDPDVQREFSKVFGRTVTGTGMIVLGYHLAKEGKVSPAFRTDKSVRDREDVAGRPPSTIEIGGRRYALTDSPAGMMLTIGASIWADENEGKGRTPLQAGIMNTGNAILDMPLMQGMRDATESVRDPVNSGARWMAGSASSLVPTWSADIAAAMDRDVDRAARSPQEAVAKRVPLLREGLPEKRDPLGRVRERQAILNPLDKGDEATDPIGREFGRLRIRYQAPNRQNDPKKPLYDADEAAYQNKLRVYGEAVQEAVLPLLSSPDYKALTDDEKRTALAATIKRSRTFARERLLAGGAKIGG